MIIMIITVAMGVSTKMGMYPCMHHPRYHDHDYHRCHGRVHCAHKDGDCESDPQVEPSLRKSQEGEMPEQKTCYKWLIT